MSVKSDTQQPQSGENKLVVGRISGAYGIKGWVKIHSFTQPLDNILGYQPWHVQATRGWQIIKVEQGRIHGDSVIAKLVGIDDRDQAEAMKGKEIVVDRSKLPELDAGEYYWTDLMGLTVVTVEGQVLGSIDHLVETGSNDVMVVKGDKERWVPFIREQVVKTVDLKAKRVIVDWPAEF